MPKYNTMFDVAFTVEHNEEDPYNVNKDLLLAALQKRIDYLKRNPQECYGAFGICDTYEIATGKNVDDYRTNN
jgi:hypothetical protein